VKVDAPGNNLAGEFAWFQDGAAEDVKGLRLLPAILWAVDVHEEYS
jgi:hypothetical protein